MYLEKIAEPKDLKNFSQKDLTGLSKELREKIISVVGKNGGHLASNLGAVELSIALHRVFETPQDAIVWDVSHQCYAHKLLTGRFSEFDTIRQHGGLSGFTNVAESEHDFFTSGHASTSISSALGLLTAWEESGHKGKVVAVIGDGALTGGLAFEGLEHAGQLSKNLIVVLNDNQMSIDHNTGSVSRYLSRLTVSSSYQSFRHRIDRFVDRIPYINKSLEKMIFRFKRSIKGLMLTNNLFVDLGFEYVGPLNGHNEKELELVLNRVSKLHRPVVVHVVTKKGKGYKAAEDNPEQFHGIGPFDVNDEAKQKNDPLTFTESFGKAIVGLGRKNEKIMAITAAMAKGTGLYRFEKKFPKRFFDVGIAEEHAVTFAGGLSRGGMIPVTCIYSTFIQRSVDQIIHDIALQNLHAVFVMDRAGAVPGDGATHQGIFDIALFRPVPGAVIMSPVSDVDLHLCLRWAVNSADSAVFIRIPKLECPPEMDAFRQPVTLGKGIFVSAQDFSNLSDSDYVLRHEKTLIVTTGGMFTEVRNAAQKFNEEGGLADIFVMRFIKPLDETYFKELALRYNNVIFVEDGVKTGGISEYLENLLLKTGYSSIKILAFEEKFYSHGNRNQVLQEAGIDTESIYRILKEK